MIAFIINMLIIMGVMWAFFRYMYPKPPKEFFAKEGDDVSVRTCDFCGGKLATYRGILIPKTLPPATLERDLTYQFIKNEKNVIQDDCYFFCNGEHQANFCKNQS